MVSPTKHLPGVTPHAVAESAENSHVRSVRRPVR
jgi:hypothetical protein